MSDPHHLQSQPEEQEQHMTTKTAAELVTFPLADHVAALTTLVLVPCPVTRELYGYVQPVLDVDATLMRFTDNYVAATTTELEPLGRGPGVLEREHAAATFEARYISVKEKMR